MNKLDLLTQYFNELKELNNVKESFETRINYLNGELETIAKELKETYKVDIVKILKEWGNVYGQN